VTTGLGGGGAPPVIRIVKKKSHEGHHGGAWKVAYADFVTAMMAFFLVMWIVGLSKPVRQAIAAYFKDPTSFTKGTGGGKKLLGQGPLLASGAGKVALVMPRKGGEEREKLKQVEGEIKKALESSPELRRLRDSISVHQSDEGLRVELLERTSSFFFDSGSARLKRHTYHVLQVIARHLRKVDNRIVIEGHTDPRPIRSRPGYSNWELSADRANSARRALEAYGLRPGQVIEVRGYADRKLLNTKDPLHFSNRRVSILVKSRA